MPQAWPLLDILLVLALLSTAASALLSRDLFRAVVLFIAFGLLMALVWVRLDATDVAMAEAAIGAGLAGVLLLKTVLDIPGGHVNKPMVLWSSGVLSLAVFGALAWAVAAMPELSTGLARDVQTAMPFSGVSHPVTAVLLNFRGFDTFLEVSVLVITAFISLALQTAWPEPAPEHMRNHLLSAFVIWLAPVTLMVAAYLYWAGSKEPGGAFQAAALLAAGGVLLRLTGVTSLSLQRGLTLRCLVIAGFGVFLLAGMIGPFSSMPLFTYPPGWAGGIIVGIEAVLSLSLGIILLSLFSTSPAVESGHER